LHYRDFDKGQLTFIRPDLKNHLNALRQHDISAESAKLADDEFNQIPLRAPQNLTLTVSAPLNEPRKRASGLREIATTKEIKVIQKVIEIVGVNAFLPAGS
jgi:hypothetical protein